MPSSVATRFIARAMLLLACAATPLIAQGPTGVVTGTVTVRGTDQPVPEPRIVIAGTAIVVYGNAQGEYRIPAVPSGITQVTAYKVGYQAVSDTVRVVAGQTTRLNLLMNVSRIQLSDVVVTGTVGDQQRRAQAAVVTSIDMGDLAAQSPSQSFSQLLQSRVPSVSVNTSSGTVGAARRINIRGASSINLSNQPLIFIDGIRLVEGQPGLGVGGQVADRLNNLNPDDIESIEVVKGPAAATLYGADASAGVIQIITRKGRAGVPRFSQRISAEFGTSDQNWTPPSNYAFCTAATIAPTSTNPLCRGQATTTLVSDNPLVRESAFRTGRIGNFGYAASGGGEGYGYFVSLNRDLQTGTLPNNEFGRSGLRTNFNFIPNSKITVNASVALNQAKLQAPINDNNIYGFLGGGLLGSPLSRRDDGSGADGWFGFERDVAAITAIENELISRNTTAGFTVNYLPTSNFSHRLTVGGDFVRDEGTSFFPRSTRGSYTGLLNTGSNTQTRRGIDRYTVDYLANLENSFRGGDFKLNSSAGVQLISTRNEFIDVTGTGFVTNANNVPSSASQTSGTGERSEVRQRGWVAQAQLGHLDRRFLQLGVRVDEFSVFGSEVDPAILPKVGFSWVLSDEPYFFGGIDRETSVFNDLRLRAAWGQTGRAPGAGAALQTFDAAPSIVGGTVESGAVPASPGNEDLKPERGEEFEFGFDASFLRERLSLEVTYFDKTTKDLILNRPLPTSLGFTLDPLVNIGEVKNRGFEVAVSATPLQMENFSWDIRGGFATLKNELTDLGGVAPFGTLNRMTEGHQLGSFVSKRIRSIDETTGVVVVSDTFEVVGNQFPTFEGTLTNTLTLFNQLRVSALLDTKRDFLIYNNSAFFRETQLVRSIDRLDPTRLSARERLRRYGNPTAGQPAFVQENGLPTTVNEAREAYLQPGDFVRLREIGVNWDIPSRWTGFMGPVEAASLGFAVQNVALWTNDKFTGSDPEVISTSTGQFTRDDFLTLPNPRTTVVRLTLTF